MSCWSWRFPSPITGHRDDRLSHQDGQGVSHTMGSRLCLEALEMALQSTGQLSDIFNTLNRGTADALQMT